MPMIHSRIRVFAGLAAAVMLFSGCTHYVITVPLENRLDNDPTCRIGPITDELPLDMTADEMPTIEDINMFKNELSAYLSELEFLEIVESEEKDTRYIVQGAILDYNKGSGVGRFLFGALANASARLVTTLELVDCHDGSIVFSGNFRAEISDWSTSGKEVYNHCARDFAKALKKQMRKFD
jgi:hypothetical protein